MIKYIIFLALASFSVYGQCGTLVRNPITKMWDCAGSSSSSAGTANVTATSAPAVTSLAIDVSSLSLTSVNPTLVQCWSGTSAPYSPVTITSLNPASTSSITANFSSTSNVTCRVNASGGGSSTSGTVTVVGSGNLTSTALVTGGGSQTIQTPSATATMDSSGNISTLGSISTGVGGSVAGNIAIGQGTAPTAGTNNITLYGNSAITSYLMRLPSAAATGFYLGTNTAGDVVMSQVAANGIGNVLLSAGTAAIASGKTLTVSNSVTLAGTDGTTMTFPSTSAAIARTDAANTFTGIQTMTSPALTTPAITGAATWQDNIRQTFNPGTNASGLNVGAQTTDPDTPSNGDIYYDSDDNFLRARINGSWVNLGAGGGGTGCNPGGSSTNLLTDDGAGACTSNPAFKYTGGIATLGTAGSVVGKLALLNATSGSITISPPTGALGTVTLTAPAATDTLTGKATTDTFTNKTIDAEATGNVITLSNFLTFTAANCQGTSAFTAFATPTANAPSATCVTGTNSNYATLDFDAATDESVQMHFPLTADWTGNIDLDVRWRAAATSGDVVWAVQTACVADGETGDPSWNTASTVTDTAKGTTLQWNDASMTTITITGCAAGEEFLYRFYRDADAGGDTMSGDAQLIWIRFKTRRAQ